MNTYAAGPADLRRRQTAVALAGVAVILVFGLLLGHAGQHMIRSLLVPGAGMYDQHLWLGIAFTVAAVVATVGWVRWGTDWAVVTVMATSVVLSGVFANSHHTVALSHDLSPSAAAHEFPLVVIVVGALGWCRGVMRRMPVLRHLAGRTAREREGIADIGALAPVDRCRTAAVAALAGEWPAEDRQRIVAAVDAPDVAARARRVGLLAHGRIGGDPFRCDHAAARAARTSWGLTDAEAAARLAADARRSWAGVPASEPGWVRLIDATLVALAMERRSPGSAERWRATLQSSMVLRRGHRPAAVWTPLGFPLGRADEWEHTAATTLARAQGWIGDEDWTALRQRCLGAAARGATHPADERTIAAARIWAVLVDDQDAARLLARPTVRRDPLAVALDAYATGLRSRAAKPVDEGVGA